MSENLPKSLSPETGHEAPVKQAERPTSGEYTQAEQEQNIEQAQQAVAVESGSTEQVVVPQLEPTDDRPQFIDKAIKTLRLRQNLTHVQNRLTPTEKRFSKVVHQPLVQLISETGAKTVGRPSGILGGGLLALVGSLAYLWLTKRYELPYNYGFFLIFFAGGFVIGLAIEYGLYLAQKLRR